MIEHGIAKGYIPLAFDSLQHVLESLATAPRGWPVEVLLETMLEDARRRIPPGSVVFEQTACGVVIRGYNERLEWLARMLLMLECPFIIRRPPGLRVALRAVASEAASLAEREA